MNRYEKMGYVLTHCEFGEDAHGLYITTEGIVGTFCGRSFNGRNEKECVEKVVDYFDEQIKYPGTMVNDTLKTIGWK